MMETRASAISARSAAGIRQPWNNTMVQTFNKKYYIKLFFYFFKKSIIIDNGNTCGFSYDQDFMWFYLFSYLSAKFYLKINLYSIYVK